MIKMTETPISMCQIFFLYDCKFYDSQIEKFVLVFSGDRFFKGTRENILHIFLT